MRWPSFIPRRPHGFQAEMPTAGIDLRKFDSLEAAEVSALPKRLRRAVQADRKTRITAALERVAATRKASHV